VNEPPKLLLLDPLMPTPLELLPQSTLLALLVLPTLVNSVAVSWLPIVSVSPSFAATLNGRPIAWAASAPRAPREPANRARRERCVAVSIATERTSCTRRSGRS
jgi:hypothetical protein